jgi:hypothetical protein
MLGKLSRSKLIAILPVLIVALAAPMITPSVHAYGPANWQVGFAGTFTTPGSGNSGFWGWCAFAGGTGSPATSGTDADCQISEYFGPSHSFQVRESISGTAWTEGPCTLPPCVTASDFYITDGTMTLTGPTIEQGIHSGQAQQLPPSCTISGMTITCPLSVWESLGVYSPDTGIPAKAGHYNLNSLIGQVGELQAQVIQLS